MTEEKKQLMHPISELLCAVYNELLTSGQVAFPLYDTQIDKIDTIVKTVNSNFYGFSRFPTNEDKASAYLFFIIKDHPVTDGNKRLSILWLEIFCTAFGLKIDLPKDLTLDMLAVAVERSELEEDELIKNIKILLF